MTVLYYTDPACPRSWAAEPGRRRLQQVFGASLEFTYVMGGLARQFDVPQRWLGAWLDAAAHSAMPVDPRMWLDAPPHGSYPACLAVLTAAEQGHAGAYLRRARESLAYEGRRLDHADALVDLAHDVPGLDLPRFRSDLSSHAVLERFGAHLERTRAAGADGLPRLDIEGSDGAVQLRGEALLDPGAWAEAATAAGARAGAGTWPDVLSALREHRRLATPEVAMVCDLPGPHAAAELWRLAAEWRVRPRRHLGGEIWALA